MDVSGEKDDIRHGFAEVIERLRDARGLEHEAAALPNGRADEPPLRLGSAQQQDRVQPGRARYGAWLSVHASPERRRLRHE